MKLHTLRFGFALVAALVGTAAALAGEGGAEEKPALVIVKVPADAELYVSGTLTKTTGEKREFDTPPLAPGKRYSYRLKAVWKEKGKEVVREARAIVAAGKTTEVDLTTADLPAPKKEAEGKREDGPAKPAPKPPRETKTPPEAKPEPPSLKLEILNGAMSLRAGESKTFTVRARRERFEGPVRLHFGGLPAKVKFDEEAVIPADKDRAEVKASAAADAPPGPQTVRVQASAGEARAEGALKLTVMAPPSPPRVEAPKVEAPKKLDGEAQASKNTPPPAAKGALSVVMPEALRLQPGGKKLLPVRVVRKEVSGPVLVTCEGLPPGVQVSEAAVNADREKAYLVATADATAAEGEHDVRVVASVGTVRQVQTITLKIAK